MKIRELFDTPDKWMQGDYAKAENGNSPTDPTAYCWCLLGAAMKCYPDYAEYYNMRDRMKEALLARLGWEISVHGWNDDPHRTFGEVKALVEELDI